MYAHLANAANTHRQSFAPSRAPLAASQLVGSLLADGPIINFDAAGRLHFRGPPRQDVFASLLAVHPAAAAEIAAQAAAEAAANAAVDAAGDAEFHAVPYAPLDAAVAPAAPVQHDDDSGSEESFHTVGFSVTTSMGLGAELLSEMSEGLAGPNVFPNNPGKEATLGEMQSAMLAMCFLMLRLNHETYESAVEVHTSVMELSEKDLARILRWKCSGLEAMYSNLMFSGMRNFITRLKKRQL